MKKIYVFLIVFALIISLISYNNVNSTFSFESYLDKVSQVAVTQPIMPETETISGTLDEYDVIAGNTDDSGVIKALKYIWTTLKLIFHCIVFALRFLVYIVEMLVYVLKIVSALFYNLIVW